MKIGHPADKPAAPPPGHATSAGGAPAGPTGTSAIPAEADASAKIELSKTASSLLSGDASADFDADKVARIAKSIDDGSFKIDPEKIADKLISNAQEVLTKVRP